MKNTFGNAVSMTIFGESHGPAVGAVLDGLAAGLPVDAAAIAAAMDRRRARGDGLSTARTEADAVEFLSGVYEGRTTGTAVTLMIRNLNTRSGDYAKTADLLRPGHADYTAYAKYEGFQDTRGGGHFSGRITAASVAAGTICETVLNGLGVKVYTHIAECAGVQDAPLSSAAGLVMPDPQPGHFALLDASKEEAMQAAIRAAGSEGDSVGGILETIVTGLPAGIGEPWFDSVESELAHLMFAIPACKGIEFGAGFGFAAMHGSEANDPFTMRDGKIATATNKNGGINGGITNGMPVEFTVTFRPTPSIAPPQETIDLETMTNTKITIGGRHDACIALRAPVVVESAAALALWRLKGADGGGELDNLRGQLDILDTELTALFVRRQSISRRIGAYKREHHLPVQDVGREEQVLHTRGQLAPERRQQVERLFRLLMELSREEQT